MEKVELQAAEHLGDDDPVLGRHVHANENDRRAEVHAHELRQDEHDDVGRFTRRYFVEELGEGDEEAANRRHDDAADEDEADVLRPECNVEFNAEPLHRNLSASRHHVLLADPIEYDVDCANKDLIQAIKTKEFPQKVKVSSLQGLRPSLSLLHVLHVVQLEEKLPLKLLEAADFEPQLTDI